MEERKEELLEEQLRGLPELRQPAQKQTNIQFLVLQESFCDADLVFLFCLVSLFGGSPGLFGPRLSLLLGCLLGLLLPLLLGLALPVYRDGQSVLHLRCQLHGSGHNLQNKQTDQDKSKKTVGGQSAQQRR